ncbi:hypothetical protein CVN68_11540 [Sphingomonas psychrotolerans]|uniref:OmpA-like domain-containing protein n=1 Tax=Sphingomonas psychrotolerans TaxID=1327635 RepID=A0A2K8ML24_9SPHN|nr:hypothetical protein CVN68_11540 [Sphingomonas psychrotolerans]
MTPAPTVTPTPPAGGTPSPSPSSTTPQPAIPALIRIFFEWDQSDLAKDAPSGLDRAVAAYNKLARSNQWEISVMIAGHTDRSGSASYNVGLSQRRADSAKAYLTAHGIPDGVIGTEAFGEFRPLVPTADGVTLRRNRRAEITFAIVPAAPAPQ